MFICDKVAQNRATLFFRLLRREEKPDRKLRFTLTWVQAYGQWELRRNGESEVIERDQYRNDLFSAIQSGRIK